MAPPKTQDSRRPSKRAGTMAAQARRRNCFYCKEKIDEVDYKNFH